MRSSLWSQLLMSGTLKTEGKASSEVCQFLPVVRWNKDSLRTWRQSLRRDSWSHLALLLRLTLGCQKPQVCIPNLPGLPGSGRRGWAQFMPSPWLPASPGRSVLSVVSCHASGPLGIASQDTRQLSILATRSKARSDFMWKHPSRRLLLHVVMTPIQLIWLHGSLLQALRTWHKKCWAFWSWAVFWGIHSPLASMVTL